MADKVRVHELAKELDISNDELLKMLQDEGIDASSHLSAIESDIAELVKEHYADSVAEDEVEELDEEEIAKVKDKKADRPRKGRKRKPDDDEKNEPAGNKLEIPMKPPFIVKELANEMGVRPNALIQELMKSGVFATINESVDEKTAAKLCKSHGFTLIPEKRAKGASAPESVGGGIAPEEVEFEDNATESRAPVIAFLGHVDHGKTSLLDKIRSSDVAAGEAGGITQHIGASQIVHNDHKMTFVDTPGHEAFTAMRARGANTTDIVVLIVAADDGFMPQTVEALSHVQAADVPFIIAINKCDLPAADPDQVLLQMQQNGITSEDWGGDVGVIRVSAATGEGIDELLERITLEAEMLELKANPDLPVRAVVLESQLEQGLGNTVNILVKNGTIKVGDTVISGPYYGRVKALIDSQGQRIKSAGPSDAVRVVGLSGLPECGAIMAGCEDEKQAKRLAEEREDKARETDLQSTRKASLDDLFRQIEEEARNDLNVIIKTDVQGTTEAVIESLRKIESDKIRVEVIHSGVGSITENDVLLASASDAIIIGFHVRVNTGVNKLAKEEGVEIRLYSIIYELIEQVKEAMLGMLAPDVREVPVGKAEIVKIFNLTKGKVCGCMAKEGKIRVGAHARVYREDDVIYNGVISSLRRFQDDVREVDSGLECGIRLDNFIDFEPGDVIDVYDYKEEAAKL